MSGHRCNLPSKGSAVPRCASQLPLPGIGLLTCFGRSEMHPGLSLGVELQGLGFRVKRGLGFRVAYTGIH